MVFLVIFSLFLVILKFYQIIQVLFQNKYFFNSFKTKQNGRLIFLIEQFVIFSFAVKNAQMILISWQKPSEHLPTNIFPFINYYCLWLLRTIVHQQKKYWAKSFFFCFLSKKNFLCQYWLTPWWIEIRFISFIKKKRICNYLIHKFLALYFN